MNHIHFPASFGSLWVSWTSEGLLNRIEWSEQHFAVCQNVKIPAHLNALIERIRAYFDQGEPIGVIPWEMLDQSNWSDFQKEVYYAVAKIPHGETRTYGWVASKLGNAAASRAVGQALKKNPLPILIPCHRILATTSMGGFMGAVDPAQPELQLKRKLMLLEEEYCSPLFSFLTPQTLWKGSEVRG